MSRLDDAVVPLLSAGGVDAKMARLLSQATCLQNQDLAWAIAVPKHARFRTKPIQAVNLFVLVLQAASHKYGIFL